MRISLFTIGLLLGASGFAAEDGTYPRSDLLVESKQLATPESGSDAVILDARNRQQYEQGHVPAARWVDHAAWAREFEGGTDSAGWSNRIGQLGIAADSHVVVYDDGSVKDAARIWWILRYWGVKDVRLLNGGWAGWMNGNLPIETKRVSPPMPINFNAKADTRRLATKSQILGLLPDKEFQIVDARSEKEFCGTEKLTNKRAGAIPGSKQLEWIELIDTRTHRFKSADDLRKLFQESGIELNRRTATHCQSGGRAAVMAFVMELMGAKEVSNYYSSWSEWGNADDTPVVIGVVRKR